MSDPECGQGFVRDLGSSTEALDDDEALGAGESLVLGDSEGAFGARSHKKRAVNTRMRTRI